MDKRSIKSFFEWTAFEWTIVFLMLAFVVFVSIPNYVGGGHPGIKGSCINNLRQIDGAKQQWALENQRSTNDIPTEADVAKYLMHGEFPKCPSGGKYTINAVSTDPTCSVAGHVLPTP